MHRPHRSGRRQRCVCRPRHHRTAPVVFYLPQACEHDYDDYVDDYGEHHYRYTEQHYLEDLDEGSGDNEGYGGYGDCLLYTSPSPRDATLSRMPSSA